MNQPSNTCVLCDGIFFGFGNNADPLADGVCCDPCNTKVILDRIRRITQPEPKPNEEDSNNSHKKQAAMLWELVSASSNDIIGDLIAMHGETEVKAAFPDDYAEHLDEEEEEEALRGDLCAGASDPCTVILHTMAGGGAHWWNYEVHYDQSSGEQECVYINDINGQRYQRGKRLYYHEDNGDQLLLEDKDFGDEKWHEMMHHQ